MIDRILITGSRNYPNLKRVEEVLEEVDIDTIIIHGGAPGVDTTADTMAHRRGLQQIIYPAPWNHPRRRRAAGPIRNSLMLEHGHPSQVWAFWDGMSRGTKDTINKAKRMGIPVTIYEPEVTT